MSTRTPVSSSGDVVRFTRAPEIPVVVKITYPECFPEPTHRSSGDDKSNQFCPSDSDLDRDEANELVKKEAELYFGPLAPLMGTVVPTFYGLWCADDGGEEGTAWLCVLERVGPAVSDDWSSLHPNWM